MEALCLRGCDPFTKVQNPNNMTYWEITHWCRVYEHEKKQFAELMAANEAMVRKVLSVNWKKNIEN